MFDKDILSNVSNCIVSYLLESVVIRGTGMYAISLAHFFVDNYTVPLHTLESETSTLNYVIAQIMISLHNRWISTL